MTFKRLLNLRESLESCLINPIDSLGESYNFPKTVTPEEGYQTIIRSIFVKTSSMKTRKIRAREGTCTKPLLPLIPPNDP